MSEQIKKDLMFKEYNNIKTIIFVGGTHGNEKSGFLSLKKFNFPNYKNIVIINIPRVNIYGTQNNLRNNSQNIDMNRFYGNENSDILDIDTKKKLIFIQKQIIKSDYVIDFHEAKKGFRSRDNKGIGNTIITQNNNFQSRYIICKLNENLCEGKLFTLLKKKKNIKFSLRDFCNQNNINYSLVEVSKSQKIKKRTAICKMIITYALEWLILKNN